jgi:hypothetical protein
LGRDKRAPVHSGTRATEGDDQDRVLPHFGVQGGSGREPGHLRPTTASSLLLIISDEKLSSDLLRGRGKSIDKISTLMKKASNKMNELLQSLCHDSVSYQSMCTRINLIKKAKFMQAQLTTQTRIRKNATEFIDE